MGIEASSPPWLALELLMKLFGGSSRSPCEGLIYSDEKSGGGRHQRRGGRDQTLSTCFFFFFLFILLHFYSEEETRKDSLRDDCGAAHVTERRQRSVLGPSDSNR